MASTALVVVGLASLATLALAGAEQGPHGSQGAPQDQLQFTPYLKEYLPPGDYEAYTGKWTGQNKAQWRRYTSNYSGDYHHYLSEYGKQATKYTSFMGGDLGSFGKLTNYSQYVELYSAMAGKSPSSGKNVNEKSASQQEAWKRAMEETIRRYVPEAYRRYADEALKDVANTSRKQWSQQQYRQQPAGAGAYWDYQQYTNQSDRDRIEHLPKQGASAQKQAPPVEPAGAPASQHQEQNSKSAAAEAPQHQDESSESKAADDAGKKQNAEDRAQQPNASVQQPKASAQQFLAPAATGTGAALSLPLAMGAAAMGGASAGLLALYGLRRRKRILMRSLPLLG